MVVFTPTGGGRTVLLLGAGQSLWEGSDGAVTTSAKKRTYGYKAYPENTEELRPATVANTQRRNRGEHPLLGMASHVVTEVSEASNVVLLNVAVGGSSLAEVSKGTEPYEFSIRQAARLRGLSRDEEAYVGAVTFGLGETDSISGTPKLDFLSRFERFAEDYDRDLRAATGQNDKVVTICYQLNSTGRDIGDALLQGVGGVPSHLLRGAHVPI